MHEITKKMSIRICVIYFHNVVFTAHIKQIIQPPNLKDIHPQHFGC